MRRILRARHPILLRRNMPARTLKMGVGGRFAPLLAQETGQLHRASGDAMSKALSASIASKLMPSISGPR